MVSYQYQVKDGRFFIEQMPSKLTESEKKIRLEEIDQIERDNNKSQNIAGILGLLFLVSGFGLAIKSLYDRAAEYDE